MEAMKAIKGYLSENGRHDGFGFEAQLSYHSGPNQWADEANAWKAAGADYVSIRGMAPRGRSEMLSSLQDHIDILSTYWDAVGATAY